MARVLLPTRAYCSGKVDSRCIIPVDTTQLFQLLYTPQAIFSVLTASAFAQRVDHFNIALVVHAACWIAQFIGHGIYEGRSPALLDNIVGGNDPSRYARRDSTDSSRC